MSLLPVVAQQGGNLALVDENGEVVALRDAPDHALLLAVERVREIRADLQAAERALACQLRERHGVGTSHVGSHDFTIREDQRWPDRATYESLSVLKASGAISQADVDRAMPLKRKPDAQALKALLGRLMVSDPDAAKVLATACSVSPPSVRDVRVSATDATTA